MKNSIVLIVILLSLVACNDSNPTNTNFGSSSSQNQAFESSSSIAQISSSTNTVSSSEKTSSSSSDGYPLSQGIEPVYMLKENISKKEVYEYFKISEIDIQVANKWFNKWDSVRLIEIETLDSLYPYKEIIDSALQETGTLSNLSWCEIDGEQFTISSIKTANGNKYFGEYQYQTSTTYLIQNNDTIIVEYQYEDHHFPKPNQPSLYMYKTYTNIYCKHQSIEVKIRSICENEDNGNEMLLNWATGESIGTPLNMQQYFGNPYMYNLNIGWQLGACIL